MTFYGNPNSKISAIDTSGGIACSRTTGQTPCPIQVSASEITCTGVIVNTDGSTNNAHSVAPFQDLEFNWDWGDTLSTDTILIRGGPRRGRTVSSNSGQIGPAAVHWYRSAGTYTITLTVRGKNGSGFTTATVTRDVTVTAYNASGGHWYFDWDFAGVSDGSIGAPFKTIAQLNTKAAIASAWLSVKRGTHKIGTSGVVLGGGPLRIDAYGSGADPILELSAGSERGIDWILGPTQPGTFGDIVISDLDLIRSGDNDGNIIRVLNAQQSGGVAIINDFYLDNVDLISNLSSGTGRQWCQLATLALDNGLADSNRFGVRVGSCVAMPGDTAVAIGYFGGARNWQFWTAISDINGKGEEVFDHHIYPVTQTNGLFHAINFGDGGPDGLRRSYCINTDWDPLTGEDTPVTARYHVISECNMTGTSYAHDGSNGNSPANSTDQTRFTDFVVQMNDIHDLVGPFAAGPFFYCITSGTWRDNNFWNNAGNNFIVGVNSAPGLAELGKCRLYRNNFYYVSPNDGSTVFDYINSAGPTNYTAPQQITDNNFILTNTDARAISFRTCASQQSAGSIVDRNRYQALNDSDGKLWFDTTTAKTLSEWRAFGFDVNGSVGDLNFVDPANGNFNTPIPPQDPPPPGSPSLNPITTTTLRHRNFHVPEGYSSATRKQASVYGHSSNQRLGSTFRSGSPGAHRIGAGTRSPPPRRRK